MRDYRLPRQVAGTRIALSRSRLGPDHMGVRMGTIVATQGNSVFVDWDGESEGKIYDSGDLRYHLDRGLLRLTPPPKPRRTRLPKDKLRCPRCGKLRKEKCGCPRRSAPKPEEWGRPTPVRQLMEGSRRGTLTDQIPYGSMTLSSSTDHEEDDTMAETTLSPKEIAADLGTDAKTFRRFLRSDRSGWEGAGQGNRYAFTPEQAASLKAKFADWNGSKTARSEGSGERKKRSKGKGGEVPEHDFGTAARRRAAEEEDLEELDLSDLDELEGPSDDELTELEDTSDDETEDPEPNGDEPLAGSEDEVDSEEDDEDLEEL